MEKRNSRKKRTLYRKTTISLNEFSQIIDKGSEIRSPIENHDFSKSSSKSQQLQNESNKQVISQVGQNEDDRSEDDDRFCTSELINRFITLFGMMCVMILLGMVTPRTILSNRQPYQRYIQTRPVKSQLSTQFKSQLRIQSNFDFDKQIQGNHFSHIQIYYSDKFIPQRQKIQLQSPLNTFQLRHSLGKEEKYNYEDKIKDLQSSLQQQQKQTNSIQKILNLLQITHNIDYDGRLYVNQQAFETHESQTGEQKYNRMKSTLLQQKQYYEQKYNISTYINNQVKFCVCVSLSGEQQNLSTSKKLYYQRTLDSIFQQEYENYHTVFIDDVSTDNLTEMTLKYMNDQRIPTQKYIIIRNSKRQGDIHNIYMAAHNYCQQGQIILVLNQNNALIGRQVFSLLNSIYQQKKTGIILAQSLKINNNQVIVKKYQKQLSEINILLDNQNIKTSNEDFNNYLKTMYVDLFRRIDIKDLMYSDKSKFYQINNPLIYIAPCIQLAGQKLIFLNEKLNQNRFNPISGQSSTKEKQEIRRQIIGKQRYQTLKQMQFINHPIIKSYSKKQLSNPSS